MLAFKELTEVVVNETCGTYVHRYLLTAIGFTAGGSVKVQYIQSDTIYITRRTQRIVP
jgi:hypothetical protein